MPNDKTAPKRSTQTHGGRRSGRTKDLVAEPLGRERVVLVTVAGTGRAGGRRGHSRVGRPLRRRKKREGLGRISVAVPQSWTVHVRRGGRGGRTDAGGVRIARADAIFAVLTGVRGLNKPHLLHEDRYRPALYQQGAGKQEDQEAPPSDRTKCTEARGHDRRELVEIPSFSMLCWTRGSPPCVKTLQKSLQNPVCPRYLFYTREAQKHSPRLSPQRIRHCLLEARTCAMDRRSFLNHLAWASLAPVALSASACNPSRSTPSASSSTAPDTLWVHARPDDLPALQMSSEEWRSVVSAEEYEILFEAGTEPRGSSPLLKEKREGTYVCAACQLPLFSSKTKYESGTGWPSFWAPLDGQIDTKKDMKLGYPRTEYHCKRCGGHQGHVFEDGPEPTGLRYCNNGLALDFVPADQPLPALRS